MPCVWVLYDQPVLKLWLWLSFIFWEIVDNFSHYCGHGESKSVDVEITSLTQWGIADKCSCDAVTELDNLDIAGEIAAADHFMKLWTQVHPKDYQPIYELRLLLAWTFHVCYLDVA